MHFTLLCAEQKPLRQHSPQWRAGTFCSGTDCPLLVWDALLASASEYTGSATSHAMDMGCSNGRVKDDTGRRVELPHTDLIAAGFPCDDASGLHPKSSTGEQRLCVANGELRTGGGIPCHCAVPRGARDSRVHLGECLCPRKPAAGREAHRDWTFQSGQRRPLAESMRPLDPCMALGCLLLWVCAAESTPVEL